MKTLAIIDGDSLLYFNMGGDSILSATNALNERICEICDAVDADRFVMYLTPERCFRYDIAKTRHYKGNRRKVVKPPMLAALRAYATDTLGAVIDHYFEADDMVAIHRNHTEGGIIAAIDKDVLCQIEGRHWNYRKNEWHETSKDAARRFLYLQILTGDSGDNIPGLPGVGLKTAEKMLSEGGHNYGKTVSEAYLKKYGKAEYVNHFNEQFFLVKIRQRIFGKSKEERLATPFKVDCLPGSSECDFEIIQ